MALVPEIKLIRTDTTLDLSQKAEKVCLALKTAPLYRPTRFAGETGMRKLFLKIRARARARALTGTTVVTSQNSAALM